MVRTLFLCLLFLCSFNAVAQQPSLSDTLRLAFDQKPSFTAKFNTRNSFVTGRPVRTYGVKAGANFNNKVAVGVGFHWLEHDNVRIYNEGEPIEQRRELRMAYIAGYFDYIFVRRQHWEITMPVQIGIGTSKERVLREEGTEDINRGGVLLYEPGMIAEYRFLKYFGIGAGVGLRIMLINNGKIDEQFTAPLYELRFRIRFGDIWKDLNS